MKPYRVISADSHAIEPPDLWQTYLPQTLRHCAPCVVSQADGDIWVCEGLPKRAAKRPMGAVAKNQARAAVRQGGESRLWERERRRRQATTRAKQEENTV